MDADTTPALSAVLTQAVCDENPHLVLDLSAITVLDPTGLNALFAVSHHHDTAGGGGHLAAVIDPNSDAIPHVYLAALDMIFDLHTHLPKALHACATPPLIRTTKRPLSTAQDCSLP
jgi:hypothetical protein